MLNWLRRLLWGRNLHDVINETKIVKVHGIRFHIRKMETTAFLDGSKVLLQHYDTYKVKAQAEVPEVTKGALEKMKAHYSDVFLASVIEPKLVRKREQADADSIFVEYLFTEWELANELYGRIVEFTFGKKKFQQSTSHVSAS